MAKPPDPDRAGMPDRASMPDKPSMNVRAVVRATDILQSFVDQPLQSLGDVAAATGLDKGTTRRLLVTLMSRGFVAQDPVTQRYGLGHAVRTLASSVVEHFDLRAVAVPILTEIAADLHVTTFLSVYRDRSALCLERLHDMKGMEVRWWPIGGTLPLNCGGAPKLLLSYQPEEEIEAALAGPLDKMTPVSVTDPAILRRELRAIRSRGWVFAVDDVALGLAALAVPVLDKTGGIVCALSMGGLSPQLSDNGRPVYLERMQAAAGQMATQLGLA